MHASVQPLILTSSGLWLRMAKDLDPDQALEMNEKKKTGSLPVYNIMYKWGVDGWNLGQISKVEPVCSAALFGGH